MSLLWFLIWVHGLRSVTRTNGHNEIQQWCLREVSGADAPLFISFWIRKRLLNGLHIDKLHISALRVRRCHLSASFICFNGKIPHKVREVKVFRESCAALLFMTNINNSAVRPHLSYYGDKLHIQNLLKHHTYHLVSQLEAELRGADSDSDILGFFFGF